MCSKLFDEVQNESQDELIQAITDKLTSPRIRFLAKEERTSTDDELEAEYDIYNILIYITNHSKKSKKPEYKITIGHHFNLELFGSDLDYPVESHLKGWGRSAASTLVSYFKEHYDNLYIGILRFDLLTKDKQNFIIPNFRFETNIFLYNSIADANASHTKFDMCLRYHKIFEDPKSVPYEKFVEEKMEDNLQIEQFQAMLKSGNNPNKT